MSAEIRPALSPERWAAELSEESTPLAKRVEWAGSEIGADDILSDPFAIMALCNHALPDDDPRKLVRADVQTLVFIAERMDRDYVQAGISPLRQIADKLAALLPPDA